ncbi:MAG: glycoside hydrolase family 5 protein, partial [Lachnospiraceae bacterium]|nr:glycoside hydrolase family 5 protein [Lachnospiraceae bacterium]
MKRGLQKKILAGLMSFALVVPSSGIFALADSQKVSAEEDKDTVLTKILGAEDISLRMKWNDKSNIGDEHEVTLSNGSTIKVKDNGTMRKEMTAQQLADTEMGMGINLGNTLEAVQPVENKPGLSGADFDKAWSNPETTREYIDLLHSYGINTLRIPVAWSNGDIDDGNYNIRGELLDRVEVIVNFALDNGMYVVINDHWDNQWWGQFGACTKDAEGNKIVDEETRKAAWTRYEKYWTQICERFKDYSDHLIFEGANEELGDRLNDAICINGPSKGYCKPNNATSDIQTVTGNLTTEECYKTTNAINQKFVDIVRKSGGNNTNRHLLIAGYDTNIEKTVDERFIMPTDIAENGKNKLFVSVHYYTPWDFCGDGGAGDYTIADQEETTRYFKMLERFSNDGYAVIIGECGVCNPSAVTGSVTQWFNDTFTESAKYHAVPVLWDTGALFDRTKPAINYKDIAIFFNTINDANGDTSAERNTGGSAPAPSGTVAEVP